MYGKKYACRKPGKLILKVMNEFANNIKTYTAADIQRYLLGTMNAADMHAFEKAALEDPFLSDAIDGMREAQKTYSPETITANLQQLREEVTSKASGGSVVPIRSFRWWQVAAAACIVVIGGALAYNTWFKNESDQPIANIDQKEIKLAPVPGAADFTIAKKDSSKEIISKIDPEKKKESPASSESKNREVGNSKPVLTETTNEVASAPPSVKRKEELKDTESNSKEVSKVPERDKPKNDELDKLEDKATKSRSATDDKDLVIVNEPERRQNAKSAGIANNVINLNFFNGKILDTNKQPVANATVQLANTNNGYLTDQFGFFKFPSTDTIVDVQVSVVGYTPQQFQLRNSIPVNQLQLQPASSTLSEVVVTKTEEKKSPKGRINHKNKFPSVLVQDAEPSVGWIEFERYIEANKKKNTTESAKIGEVVISFQVNRHAGLSGFKIEQSLSQVQDEEAIRLIKEGPSWRLLKGKKARVMVIVKF